jgi:CPA1 family monovalent cation:H+ antiporter
MYIGIRNPELVPSATRLNLAGFWDIITYLLNGTLFLLTGLQFRSIVTGASQALGIRVLGYGLMVTAVIVVLRFAWSWPAAWIDHHLPIPTSYNRLPNRHLTFLAWCGMRGGISLAAALSLSQTIPSRQTTVLVTACVVAGTLIFQGAPLPFLLRKLRLDKDARHEVEESMHQERKARLTGIRAALEKLRTAGSDAKSLRGQYQHRLHLLQHGEDPDSGIGPTGYRQEQVRLHLDAVAAEREAILGMYRQGKLPEHVLHRIERDLDLTEVRLEQFLSRSD